MRPFLSVALALLAVAASPADAKTVRVCLDEVESPPLFHKKDGKPVGTYLDLARDALKAAGYDVEWLVLPWSRCVNHMLRNGQADSALSAAWTKERAEYAHFPANAETEGATCKAKEALICNGPVLLVPVAEPYVHKGDYKAVPQPVRIPHGYVQVDEYKKRGVKVDPGPDDEKNLAKMLRDGTGSVLMWFSAAQGYAEDARYKGKFKLVEGFADLSDGFLPFSKKSSLTAEERAKIWAEVARVKPDAVLKPAASPPASPPASSP